MKVLLCTVVLAGTVFCGCATTKPEDTDSSSDKPILPGLPEASASTDPDRSGQGDPSRDQESGEGRVQQEFPEGPETSGIALSGSGNRKPGIETPGPDDNAATEGTAPASPVTHPDTITPSSVKDSRDESVSAEVPEPEISLPDQHLPDELGPEDLRHDPLGKEGSRAPPVTGESISGEPVTPPSGESSLELAEPGATDPAPTDQGFSANPAADSAKSPEEPSPVDLPAKDPPAETKLPELPETARPPSSVPASANASKEGEQEFHEEDGSSVLPESTEPDEGDVGRGSKLAPREKSLASWLRQGKAESSVGFSDELPPESASQATDSTHIGFTDRPGIDSWLQSHPIRRVGFSDKSGNRVDVTEETSERKISFRDEDWEYRSTASWLRAREQERAPRPSEGDRSYEATKAWLERNLPDESGSSEWTPREYAQVEEWLRTEGEAITIKKLTKGSSRTYRALSRWLVQRPAIQTARAPASIASPRRDYSKVMKWLRDSRDP
ncbi:MAG: hypothetical protein AAEJ57_02835 [Opitutales bacterium]